MMKNNYVTPESELLIVRFEENFCGTIDNTEKPVEGGDEDF